MLKKSIPYLLIATLVFGAFWYSTKQRNTRDLMDNSDLSDTRERIAHDEYVSDAIWASCHSNQDWYERKLKYQIDECEGENQCIKEANDEFAGIHGQQFILACVESTYLNDKMTKEVVKGYDEQTQLLGYAQQAKKLSDENLVSELKQGLMKLVNEKYETNLALQMSADLQEYEMRKIKDTRVDDLASSMLSKYSPCWGIPTGQCRE
jgi:hypothetical protein